MAKALVEVIGDSASAVRALEATSAAFDATGKSAATAAGEVDAFAASLAKAQASRAETLLAQAGSLRQLSASGTVSQTEAMAANEAALKRQTQAYKLLGVQAASTGESVAKTAGTIGRGLTTYVTAPAAFVGYEAVKQALDYNQALLLIRTQAGATQSELTHMNSAVLQLVQSGQSYGQTAQSMAQGLYYVESENIRGARALAILHAAAAGAAKGQTDMADTTNALTSAMKIWNLPASEAVKTMATIDAVTATGKMHLEDLNNAFQTKFFTTAKQLGIPLEQAGAALDVFTKAGVPAEVAANNMTTSFIKMVTPAKAAIPYLQQLGLNADSLGNDLQSGGLTKALAALADGYDRLVQSQGKASANRAVLESFGGSRSGAPALALVQQYASYAQSLGEIQRLNNPATFWSQVSEAMDQPAMKIKKDVAEIGADFIKLGTAIAPTVAAIASGVADISTAFGSLPSFVKDSIGVVVTALAVGGPVGLAISGIGKLLDALGIEAAAGAGEAAPAISTIGAAADRSAVQLRVLAYTERAVGPAAAEGAATADTSLSLVGASALGAESKVATLRSTLLGLAGRIFTVSIVADILYHYRNQLAHGAANLAGHLGANSSHGGQPGPLDFLKHPIRSFFYSPAVHDTSSSGDNTRSYHDQQTQGDAGHTSYVRDYEREQHRKRFVRQHGGSPLYQLPAVPQKIQLDIAKAQAGYGSVAKAMDEERHWLLELIKSGRLKGQALTQAYQALASIQTKAVTDAHKATAQFDATVHNDTLLARARNDLAQGEVSVAQHLLALDEQRLQAMLSEAKTAEERKTVLNQLAEVNRLRHSKSSAFALSPRLQEEIAKADAIAALHPSSYGPDSDQIRLARQAKAAALKAIHSHTLTLQGLTQAWQIVGQENAILAQAKGAIDTYHAVSSKAIVDSVKGLSQVQQMQLRERIAQEEAHRGYAPNRVGGRHHHYHRVDVHVHSNDSHIVKVVKKHDRGSHQRAGGRR